MTQHDLSAEPSIVPLRKRNENGTLYRRRADVEQTLCALLRLPVSAILERCRIADSEHPDYVPSECVVYLFRRPPRVIDQAALHSLFEILRKRILRAVPVVPHRVAASEKRGENSVALEIREDVLHKFNELLCSDHTAYDERLDFYEVQFNLAVAALRTSALRRVLPKASRRQPLSYQEDTNDPSEEVEKALAAIRNPEAGESVDFLFRSKMHVAISSLPDDERRVVELLLKEIPIDSKDKDVLTIARILSCTEKTVRNRRDRAFAKLRDALREEDV